MKPNHLAVFYSGNLSMLAMQAAAAITIVLYIINIRGVTAYTPYILLGAALWVAVFNSGVHPTVAGVILGFMIPMKILKKCIDKIHPWTAFMILPIFAFFNSGLNLAGGGTNLLSSVTLGIATGLFVGKQLGVFSCAWIAIKIGVASRPKGVSWSQLYGVSIITGIGFTMSLFIASLAYVDAAVHEQAKLGIIIGSMLSAVVGYIVLSRR